MQKTITLLALSFVLTSSVWALDKDDAGVYQIGTAQDLIDFAAVVNGGDYTASAVLTADIDMANQVMDPIGKYSDNAGSTYNGVNYKGVFDGQGHVIKNLNVDVTLNDDKYEVGLFGRLRGATIKNLGIINGTFVNTGNARGGVLCGFARNGTNNISNVYAVGTFTVTSSIEASLIGGTNGGTTLTNCYTTLDKLSSVNSPTVDNSYAGVSADELENGELCFMLNGKASTNCSYFQNLPGDDYPILDNTHAVVYINGEFLCDGSVVEGGTITYSNSSSSTIPDHQYDSEGICTVCHSYQQPTVAADGYYEIGNKSQLLAFADIISKKSVLNMGKKVDVNARLTTDIDLAGVDFQPMCKHIDNDATYGNNYGFGGIFDGQGHEILNLTIDVDDTEEAAFFSRVRDGEIKNLGFRNASVKTAGYRAAVLAGGCYSTINNCYVVGNIEVAAETGTELGTIGGQIRFHNPQNCYTTYDTFYGSIHKNSSLNNCYYGEEARNIVATGELCYKLNGDQSTINFHQTLGTDTYPNLTSTDVVNYVGAAGYTTMYDPVQGYELLGDATVCKGSIQNTGYLHLDEIGKEIPVGAAVVIKGTYYNMLDKDDAVANTVGNILLGSDSNVTADGSQYVLAQVDDVVGFYKAVTGTTIAAGKAYIESASGVKGFVFEDENATGIQSLTTTLSEGEGAIYNLAGQRVNKAQKGIFIQKGKKYLF